MAQLGGLIAAAMLKVVGDQIGSAIGGQIKLQKNLSEDLEKMKMALESVEAVLKDAERLSITDNSTRLWLKRLRDAMYVIADMIDEFESDSDTTVKMLSLKRYLAIAIPCFTIVPKIRMANKMQKMREHLEVITDQHKNFDFSSRIDPNELKAIDVETSSNMETEIIVGRTEEREKLLCSLSKSMTKEITVLPIYGIGGLGKTTLAKMVYNSPQFNGYSKVWIHVSQTFDLKKVRNSIIAQLSSDKKSRETDDLQTIENSLSELLADKKILIVLDDLWEDNKSHLERLMAIIKVGKGSKVVVLVTTRAEGIAQNISTIPPDKLEPLTNNMCWSIIKQKSGFESRGDKDHLEEIGMDIAMKCGGVALAAQSLGHMLKSMTDSEWESVRNSDIWNISSSEDTLSTNVLASLRLSYSVMPPYLKLCFAYCAIFPKGHKIVKDDLIYQWASLGLIEPENVFSISQLGERYIRKLVGLSFLQDSKSPSIAEVYHEDITLLTMHDLIHDLARSVMVDEILVTGKHGNTGGSCYHYALLNDCSKPLDSSKIRALRFMDCGEIGLHHAAFSSARSLRVLDLSECSIHKLPGSIGLLKQLKYLNAPRVKHKVIPDSITKLSKLMYLNLHGSQIIGLPESIGDIKGLMYLDLSGCSELLCLPDSFGDLKNVVHLDLSNCSRVGGVSLVLGNLKKLHYLNLSYCRKIGELPEALGALSELQYLNLSYCSYVECLREAEFLGSLTKLEYLNLSSNSFSLKKISKAIGNFVKLKYLNLSRSIGDRSELFDRLEDSVHSLMCSISTLFNLEHLDLSNNSCIESIPGSICNLRKLHTLNLSNCRNLKKIPESIGTMASLKTLYTVGCYFLKLPQLSSNSVSLPRFMVHAGDGEGSSNLVVLRHTDPAELEIVGLENVKTAEEAQSIELMGKQSMKKLTLEWTRDAVRSVDDKLLLEKLVPPSTVIFFGIQGYNSVSSPAWLMDIMHYLPNLTEVAMWDVPNCKVLPPMDQLPNLVELVLRNMASLEEWNTSYGSGQERVITYVKIEYCPKLRIKPLPPRAGMLKISNSDSVLSSWGEYTGASTSSACPVYDLDVYSCMVPMHQWRLLQYLPALGRLGITSCGDLTGSPEVIQCLSSISSLCLREQEEIPKWVGELTSLLEVEISDCSGLTELHENMRQLTGLHSLRLEFCKSIASLPHWFGELTSLKELAILYCNVIRSLPEGIQQLTNLQQLYIRKCPALKWCETEEEIMKPTPNQKRACVLPTSLEKLTIDGCDGIRSLPEGMEQLTNLEILAIGNCPALKKWCELEENEAMLAHIEDKRFWDGSSF